MTTGNPITRKNIATTWMNGDASVRAECEQIVLERRDASRKRKTGWNNLLNAMKAKDEARVKAYATGDWKEVEKAKVEAILAAL